MKKHYSLASEVALDPLKAPILKQVRAAGVDEIWLHGYFFGHLANPLPQMLEAKTLLETYGFEVSVIHVPVGHPGNSANPDDDTLDFSLPDNWRYRIDRYGNPVYFCAEIENEMIKDSVAAMVELRNAGFTRFIMDDDLRQGNWGTEIEGCFSDRSIAAFNAEWNRSESRESLARRIESKETSDELRDWVSHQCRKVTDYMVAMAIPGVEIGTMIMPDGDERHGLDVSAIRAAVPHSFFRVGEYQYNDTTFGSPNGKALEFISAMKHLNQMDRKTTFSETTVFPDRALTAANLAYKEKLAVTMGISNIMLMSGILVLAEDYWKVLAGELDALRELDRLTSPYERSYPVHLLYGTHGVNQEPLHPSTLPVIAGLPVKPVRAHDTDQTGEVLLVLGDYRVEREWDQLLPFYKKIIFDRKAAETNSDKLGTSGSGTGTGFPQVEIWEHEAGTLSLREETKMLRDLFSAKSFDFPRITAGGLVGMVWLEDNRSIIAFNLEDQANVCKLAYNGKHSEFEIGPLSFQIIRLDP